MINRQRKPTRELKPHIERRIE